MLTFDNYLLEKTKKKSKNKATL